MTFAMGRYFEQVIRYRVTVIVLSILFTVVMAIQAKDLKVIIDAEKILPSSHPFIIGAHQITDTFGLKYSLAIGITPKQGDVYQPEVVDAIKSITTQLAKTSGVITSNIVSLAARKAKSVEGGVEGIQVRPLLPAHPDPENLANLRNTIEHTPLFQHALVSDDGRTAAIMAEYRPNPAGFRAIMAEVEPILQPYWASMDISLSGHVGILSATEALSDRVVVLLPIAIMIICGLLYAAFASMQALILPLLTGVLALVISMGVMGLTGIPLDVFNAATPILILAVVTGHAVQLLKRYFDEYEVLRAQQNDLLQASHAAIIRSLTSMAPITLSAGLAASLGFFSLTVFDIQTVRTFGMLTGLGILIGLVLEFTFVPALRAMLPPPAAVPHPKLGLKLSALANRLGEIGVSRSKTVLILAAGIAFLALVSASRVEVNNSNKSNIGVTNSARIQDSFLNQQFGGTNTVYLMLDGGHPDAVKSPEFMHLLERLQSEAELFPTVGKTVSMASHIKRLYQAFNEGKTEFHTIPDQQNTIAELLMLYSMSGDPSDFDMFVDQDYQKASVIIYTRSDSSKDITPLVNKLKAVVAGTQVKLSIGGSVPEAVGLSEVMVHDKLFNIVQIIAVVFVVAALVFRSLLAGLLVIVPVLFSVLINFGVMGITGIPLNIPTALCSAMAVGIGADYAIYLLYRAKQQATTSITKTIQQAVISAGSACLFVALSITLGYAVLMLSYDFYPHVWIGMMVCLANIVSVLATLIILPAVLMHFQPKFIKVRT